MAPAKPGREIPGTGRDQTSEAISPRLLTRHEMAAKLRVSVRTLDRMAEARMIPVIRSGRLVRFDAVRVLAAVQRNLEVKEVEV